MDFVISDVRNHRFGGTLTMLVGGQAEVPFSVMGTVSTSGEFTGNGAGPGGMVQFHGQITFIDGGAAVADATYHFVPAVQGPHDQGTATLIRNFDIAPGTSVPNGNGMWNGLATSSLDGGQSTFTLDVHQSCSSGAPGTAFGGVEVINPDSDQSLKFFFQGTLAADGRFVVIGWSFSNDRFIVTGALEPPPDPDKPATADAHYTLYFGDGSTDVGTFGMVQQLTPPDPCRIIIGQ